MDISRAEQRVLHILAQGGRLIRKADGLERPASILLENRDGWRAPPCELRIFRKLKRLRAIRSTGGGPYRITRRGLELVRSQFDNRG